MNRQPVLLGIDAGTSGVKVCAFTLDGTLVQKEQECISIISERPGFAELDVALYWQHVKKAVLSITAKHIWSVQGVGLSTTCPTIVTMDKDFKVVGHGITYLDNRAADKAEQYLATFPSPEAYTEFVGNRCSVSTCSSSTMMWIRDNEPQRWEKTAHIGMLNSFLAAQLTGKSAIDTTQASYSGIFRLADPYDWNDALLRRAGIPREKLLPIAEPSSYIGGITKEVAEQLGIDEHTPVAIGSGDTAAAAFAIGFSDAHQAFESAGTSGVLTFLMDKPQFNPLFMNRCHVIPGLWIAHGANSMMGGAVDWLRKQIFTEFLDYTVLDDRVKGSVPGAHGVVFLPYLAGERCPVWNPRAKAVWYGMTLETSQLDLLESVFEAGAYSMRQIRDYGEQLLKVSIDSVIAVGNGTKNKHWCQMKSDVLGVTYTTTAFTDAAAYGAALMGGIAANIFTGPTDAKLPILQPEGYTYQPTHNDSVLDAYERTYGVYLELYPALKAVMDS